MSLRKKLAKLQCNYNIATVMDIANEITEDISLIETPIKMDKSLKELRQKYRLLDDQLSTTEAACDVNLSEIKYDLGVQFSIVNNIKETADTLTKLRTFPKTSFYAGVRGDYESSFHYLVNELQDRNRTTRIKLLRL